MTAVRWSGTDRMGAALRLVAARQGAATQQALAKAALLVERNTKLRLSLSSHPPGTRTPSRPGEPPSLVTGNLRRSVRTRGPYRSGRGYTALVGPTAVYGRVQELGGPAGRGLRTQLPARPYLQPALRDSRADIRRIFLAEWRI